VEGAAGVEPFDFAMEDPAGGDVFGLDCDQIALGQATAAVVEQAVGLAHTGSIDCIADRAGVGEERQLHAPLDVIGEGRTGLGG